MKLLTSSVGMSKWFLSEDGFFGQEIQLQYLVYWIVSMQTALGEGVCVCVLQWTADLSLSISDCWDRRGGGGQLDTCQTEKAVLSVREVELNASHTI